MVKKIPTAAQYSLYLGSNDSKIELLDGLHEEGVSAEVRLRFIEQVEAITGLKSDERVQNDIVQLLLGFCGEALSLYKEDDLRVYVEKLKGYTITDSIYIEMFKLLQLVLDVDNLDSDEVERRLEEIAVALVAEGHVSNGDIVKFLIRKCAKRQ